MPLSFHNLFDTVEGLVAVGTIGLALATVLVATLTWRTVGQTAHLAGSTDAEVKAVLEQVEIGRLALAATVRPILVDVPLPIDPAYRDGGLYQELEHVTWPGTTERVTAGLFSVVAVELDDRLYVSVPLRNAGPGLAFIRGIGVRWHSPLRAECHATVSVLPSNEISRIQASVPTTGQGGASLDELRSYGFSIEVAYTDVGGEQWTLTRADVHRSESDKLFVRQVFLSRKVGESDGSVDWGEPFAASGPSSPIF